jgi:serine/threonine protein kinase
VGRDRDRHTETLVPVARAGFGDETDSLFDPTTRRVSTRALKELLAETVDGDSPTQAVPLEHRPPPLKKRAQRMLEELRARRAGDTVSETFGRYLLLGSVGKGGMAEVRLAAEYRGGSFRLCVVKRVAPHHADPEHMARGLREEARICRRLSHPHIVKLLDDGDVAGAPYLVFELIDGVSLRELMELVKPLRVPLLGVLEIGKAAAGALAHAHGATGDDGSPLEVVHRDVTPQNVLVGRDGAVKLVDFGIARFAGREHETRAGHVKGKLGYMAPEQCKSGPVDGKADVFALSLVLTELISGERVLPPQLIVMAESEALIRKRLAAAQYPVPPALADLLVRMAALSAPDRPPASEVSERLELLAAGCEGETLKEFLDRLVFRHLEPFEDAIALDPVPIDSEDPTWEPTYARTVRSIRPVSEPKDSSATKLVSVRTEPAPDLHAIEEPQGRALFFFVLAAAVAAFLTLVFVLTR